eukprot:gene34443-42478_t
MRFRTQAPPEPVADWPAAHPGEPFDLFDIGMRALGESPLPARDRPLFDALAPMAAHRAWLDQVITAWAAALTEADLGSTLHYARMNGDSHAKPLFDVLLHFFNHQTHHRGQASTLLSQAGVDLGVTDLLMLIPEVDP